MASNERFVDNVQNPELSDTEEMEESEAEGARGESDNEVLFRPQAQPLVNLIRRIQDSEEIADGYGLITNVFAADSSTEDEGDVEDESQNSDRSRIRRIQDPEEIADGYGLITNVFAEDSSTEEEGDVEDEAQNSDGSRIRRIQDSEEIADGYDGPVGLITNVFAEDSSTEEDEAQNSDRSRPSGYRRIQLPEDSSDNAAMSEGEARSDSDISVISNIAEVGREFHSDNNHSGIDGNSEVNSRGGQSDEENASGPNSDIEIVHDSTQDRVRLPSHLLPPTPPAAPSTLKEEEPSATSSTMQLEDDSAQMCPICFEVWNNVGSHRIVSLKCGHLFGKQCIERWLQKPANAKCPQCNAKANKRDIRVIYAKSVKVEDTSERERLMQEIERLKQENAKHEKDKVQHKMKSTQDYKFITELQKQLKLLQESTTKSTQSTSTSSEGHTKLKLGLYQTIDLGCKNGVSRVMAYNEWMNMLVVSIPSHIEMFPGFGMKKISTLDFKTENFYLLHSKQIRDMAFNSLKEDLMLSVGFDKVAKVTNVSSNLTVISYTTDALLWSCCWSRSKISDFFVGSASGVIYHFDTIANTESHIKTYNIKGSGPVVSLSYVARNPNASFMLEGLLVTRLNTVSFEELGAEGCISHDLSIEGTFTNTAFDPVSMHFITTCRPSDRNLHVRHKLYALRSSFDFVDSVASVVATEIHNFQGSTTLKLIERTCLTTHNGEQNLVAIFNEESTNSVKLCDVSTTTPIQTIKPGVNIIDILPIKGSDGECIAMLAERCIKIYKWIPQF